MPRFEVRSPDGRTFDVNAPEGATQADAIAYVQQQLAQPKPEAPKPLNAMDGVGTGQRVLEGIGQGMSDLGLGIKQRLGLASEADVAEKRRVDAPLLDTGAGKVGSVTGQIAASLPALAIPGANTVVGAAGVGALTGALQPTAQGESVAENALVGGALGGGAQHVVGRLAGAAGQSLGRAQMAAHDAAKVNAPRDEMLAQARAIGYKSPPSSIEGSGVIGRTVEGLSGKEKASQLAAVGNQTLTDKVARRAIGLAEDQPITIPALKEVREKAYVEGYKPIADLPAVNWDHSFLKGLKRLSPSSAGGAVKNPAAQEIDELVSALAEKNQWTGEQLIRDIRALREQSSALHSSAKREGGNVAKTDLARAQSKAAELLEDLATRNMGKDGPKAIAGLRSARKLIAKTHSVEDALAKSGNVDASVWAKALRNGDPLEGEMRTVAEFAQQAPESMKVPKSGWANPFTAVDFGVGVLGSPAFGLARVGGRQGLLSDVAQNRIMAPTYGPGRARELSTQELKRLRDLGVGGLLGVYSE